MDTADEGIPLCWGEVQDSSSTVFAVTNPDPVASQACDLYAVTIVCAQRAFSPCLIRIGRMPITEYGRKPHQGHLRCPCVTQASDLSSLASDIVGYVVVQEDVMRNLAEGL